MSATLTWSNSSPSFSPRPIFSPLPSPQTKPPQSLSLHPPIPSPTSPIFTIFLPLPNHHLITVHFHKLPNHHFITVHFHHTPNGDAPVLRPHPKLFFPLAIPPNKKFPNRFFQTIPLLPLVNQTIFARCSFLPSSPPQTPPPPTPFNPSALTRFPSIPPTTLCSLVLSHSPSTHLSCRALPLCLSPPLPLSHQRVGKG